MNRLRLFTLLILITIFIRTGLSFLPSFEIDQSAFRYFSSKLASDGFEKFYSPDNFTLNALGYLYVLWGVDLIKKNFFPNINFFSKDYDILLKIPANLTDIAIGILLYLLIKKSLGKNWGITGFSMYVFNPAIFFNSSIWGQYDSISIFFLLLSTWAIINKKPLLMASFFAIALSLKPQAIFFAPMALILTLTNTKPMKWFFSLCIFLLTTLIIYLPFFPKNPFYGIYLVNSTLAGTYTCTSCFAFNFWGIFGNWQNDLNLSFGIPKIYWGITMLIIFLTLFFITKPIKKKFEYPYVFLTSALSVMACYTFLTRMHDRYLFSFFPFLLLAALLLRSKVLTYFYVFMSALHFLNLYYVYIYYSVIYPHSQNILFNSFLYELADKNFKNLSLMSTLVFICATLVFIKSEYGKNK